MQDYKVKPQTHVPIINHNKPKTSVNKTVPMIFGSILKRAYQTKITVTSCDFLSHAFILPCCSRIFPKNMEKTQRAAIRRTHLIARWNSGTDTLTPRTQTLSVTQPRSFGTPTYTFSLIFPLHKTCGCLKIGEHRIKNISHVSSALWLAVAVAECSSRENT